MAETIEVEVTVQEDSEAVSVSYLRLPSDVQIHIADNIDDMETVLTRLAEDLERELEQGDSSSSERRVLLGLDTEWTSGQRVALLQVATHSVCCLLRMDRVGAVPETSRLRWLLRDPRILKCGVGVAQNLQMLRDQFALE
jgi:hypothetical protein